MIYPRSLEWERERFNSLFCPEDDGRKRGNTGLSKRSINGWILNFQLERLRILFLEILIFKLRLRLLILNLFFFLPSIILSSLSI